MAREIGTKLKLEGEKEFNAQMKAVNSGLKTTKSDMAALSAEFSENADSAKALTARQKLLQSSVDQHKAKVAALKTQYEAAASTLGENSARTQKYKQELNYATVALEKETAALERNSNALRDKYLSGLKSLASGTQSAFKGIGSVSASAAKGIGKISLAAVKAAAAVTAAGATLGVAAVTTLVNFANEAAEAAKAASEAGETLTDSQQAWLEYSDQLEALDASVLSAKSALGSILLPMLSDLSKEGGAFLDDFARDMEAAAGDTAAQTKVLSDYIVKGANLLIAHLPEYIQVGKDLLSGLGEGLSDSGPELLEIIMGLCFDLLAGIIEYAPKLAEGAMALVEQLGGSLAAHGPDLVTSAVGMVTDIIRGIAQAAPDMIPAAVQLVGQLLTALIAAAPELLLAGLELVYGLLQGIFNSLDDIVAAVGEIIETAKAAFGAKAEDFMRIGSDIVNLLLDGLKDAWDGLVSWVTNAWESAFGNRTVDVNVNGTVSGTAATDGSHAGGLDYVPFDGYIAELHRGESVLTASEAALYRQNKQGGNKTVTLNFYAQTMTEADINMVVDVVNRKLGDDL